MLGNKEIQMTSIHKYKLQMCRNACYRNTNYINIERRITKILKYKSQKIKIQITEILVTEVQKYKLQDNRNTSENEKSTIVQSHP